MTPSAPGLLRDLNSGTREAAASIPTGAPRIGPAKQSSPVEHPQGFREALRRQRGPDRDAEPKIERRTQTPPGAPADAGALQPEATKAPAAKDPAQDSTAVAQESDDQGVVSAETGESPIASRDTEVEATTDDRASEPLTPETPEAESGADALSPGAGVRSSAETAPAAAPTIETAPVPAPQQAAPKRESQGRAPTPANGAPPATPVSAEPVATAKATVQAEAPVEPAAKGASSPSAGAPTGPVVEGEHTAAPPRVSQAASAEPRSAQAASAVSEAPQPPKASEQASASTRSPSAEPEQPAPPVPSERQAPQASRADTAQSRSIFVVESDATIREARPAALRPNPETPAATPAPTSNAQKASPDAPVQQQAANSGIEDQADSSDSGSAGERREARAQRDNSAPAQEGGAPKTSQSTIGADLGVKPAPTLAEPSAAAKPAQSAPTEAQIVAQSVARGLNAAVNQKGGSITLRLSPESLGLVRIQMTLDQGAVSVRLEATNPAAQGLLTEHIAMLRGSLESRGLTVDKLSVQYAPTASLAGAGLSHGSGGSGQNSAGANQQQTSQSGEQQGAWQDAAGGESRGRREADQERNPGNFAGQFEDADPSASRGGAHAERFGGRLRLRLETVA